MQTTNSNDFPFNLNPKQSTRRENAAPRTFTPSARAKNAPFNSNAPTPSTSPLKGLEELLDFRALPKKSLENPPDHSLSSILQHLAFLRNLSAQILPTFPKNLQNHLRVGQLRKNVLVIQADSVQTARLARGYLPELEEKMANIPALSHVTKVKVITSPSFKLELF